MTDPMRHNLNKKQKRKGAIESIEQYAKVYYRMLSSPAWRSLKGGDIKLYFELRRRFNGRNNGEIILSRSEACKLLKMGNTQAQNGFKRLEDLGFVKVARRGGFIGRQANQYILTEKPYKGNHPTNDWRRWQPPKTRKKLDIGIETIRDAAYEELNWSNS